MNQKNVTIRVAKETDASELLNIYSYYVENTAITFEYVVPSVKEFSERIRNTLQKYPYIVAEIDKKIVGYAYAGTFKPREAYDWSVETTVYVQKDCKGRGIGKLLYQKLEECLNKQNIVNLYACIASPTEEDEYLTKESISFHQHLEYRFIGEFHQCGYKFNRWYNMVWMEKIIGEHKKVQPPILNFSQTMVAE